MNLVLKKRSNFFKLRLTKQVNDLESIKQTNQIMQHQMTKLSQSKITFDKEKVNLEAKIEVLTSEKQRLTVIVVLLIIFMKGIILLP